MRTPLVLIVVVGAMAAGCSNDAPDDGAASTTAESSLTGEPGASSTTGVSTSAASTTTSTSNAATTARPAIDLAGRTFVSTALTGFESPAGTQVTLMFESDRFSASGGCNQLTSTWALQGDVLVVGDIASTRMACERASLMDSETWLSALLTSDPIVTLDGDDLTLTEGQSSITLVAS